MRFTKTHQQLGCDKTDISILSQLAKRPSGALLAVLDRSLEHIPRTTLALRLKKLEQRTLVVKLGGAHKHQTWSITDTGLRILNGDLGETKQNAQPLAEAIAAILKTSKGKRIYVLNSIATEQALADGFTRETLQYFLKAIEKYNLILEGVGPASTLKLNQNLGAKEKAIIANRPTVWYLCADELLDFTQSILIAGNHVLLFNLNNQQYHRFYDPLTAETFLHIIRTYQKLGQKVDYRTLIAASLKNAPAH